MFFLSVPWQNLRNLQTKQRTSGSGQTITDTIASSTHSTVADLRMEGC